MKLIVDANVTAADQLLEPYGDIEYLPSRHITREALLSADALIVRSPTRVDASLLKGTSIRFVGSPTAGCEHLQTAYLESHHIAWTHAPGCNARAVVEYVLAAMAQVFPPQQWASKRVGIIGYGIVGSLLYQQMQGLGIHCRCYDPFLSQQATHFQTQAERASYQTADNSDSRVNFAPNSGINISKLAEMDQGSSRLEKPSNPAHWYSLEEALNCDIVSLHTPLTLGGNYPSWHLLNQSNMGLLDNTALLINSSRGEVIDQQALYDYLLLNTDLQVVLDVWENEPDIEPALLSKISLGTPHIAGYSALGKLQGTLMVAEALANFMGKPFPTRALPDPIERDVSGKSIKAIIGQVCDLESANLSLCQAIPDAEMFIELRNGYPLRKEFAEIQLSGEITDAPFLEALGFQIHR